jgi:hypothetical protein
MDFRKSDITLAYLTLICGLTISSVAIWYSVAGLVAIFAAATLPIIIMGTVLEISKLVATVWLKWHWGQAPRLIKIYLLAAITVLMFLTSMGIFGFLSRAHLDQSVPTGDVVAKVALIDEKIETERQNIETARKALSQMDSTVDQSIARSNNERGVSRAAQLRRSQQKERAQLQLDISNSQKAISQLNEERAPIAAELRKVEAEVGPIRYIAALIYEDTTDADLLEKAVRWVIIVIVLVFDPLAVILLLASQYSFQWFSQSKVQQDTIKEDLIPVNETDQDTKQELDQIPIVEQIKVSKITETPMMDFSTVDEIPKVPTASNTLNLKFSPIFTNSIKEVKKESISSLEEYTDEEILNDADATEKEAMKRWKQDHPADSLKHQRRLFDLKLVDRLPWQDYLTSTPGYVPPEEQHPKIK